MSRCDNDDSLRGFSFDSKLVLKLESVRGPCNLAALIMMTMMSASADEKWHRGRESRQAGGYAQVRRLGELM